MSLENSKLSKDFVEKYKKYLLTTEMIPYSDVKDWIGYKQKRSVQENLEDKRLGFKENYDYKIVKEKKEGICKPVNEIYMTFETIKSLCLSSATEIGIKYRKYFLELEKTTKEIVKNKLNNPIDLGLAKYEFDINKWLNKKIVYLIYIKDNLYKFGITSDPQTRFTTHRNKLDYNYVITCWDCFNLANAKKIENELKKYLKCNKLSTTYRSQTEIFIANKQEELNIIINKINELHKKYYVVPVKSDKINEELNKKLEEEDKKENFSNTELVLIEKYNKKYNLNLNKELFEELKTDVTNLVKIENKAELNNNDKIENQDNKIKDDENEEEIEEVIEEKQDLVKCTKCSKKQSQEDFGKKEDGTYYKRCDKCLEKSREVEEKRNRKPMTQEQKERKYALRKERRLLNKLNNPKEKPEKQTKEEKLEKKKIYYEENKEEIRAKYADRMSSEEAKQKENERKKAYYWNNHDKLIERNRKYYKDNAEELTKKKRDGRKNT
jgi:predicted GIY-YIG superfamily endonuclease